MKKIMMVLLATLVAVGLFGELTQEEMTEVKRQVRKMSEEQKNEIIIIVKSDEGKLQGFEQDPDAKKIVEEWLKTKKNVKVVILDVKRIQFNLIVVLDNEEIVKESAYYTNRYRDDIPYKTSLLIYKIKSK